MDCQALYYSPMQLVAGAMYSVLPKLREKTPLNLQPFGQRPRRSSSVFNVAPRNGCVCSQCCQEAL